MFVPPSVPLSRFAFVLRATRRTKGKRAKMAEVTNEVE